MSEDAHWMDEALRLARVAGEQGEVPVGAIVVRGKDVVGRGHNRRERDQDPLAHAEIDAIREASKHLHTWRLSDCVLYVTLEPCPMCLAASQQARLGKVIYGASDPKGGALSLGYSIHSDPRTHHRFDVIHLENSECGKILSDFFKERRKRSIAESSEK